MANPFHHDFRLSAVMGLLTFPPCPDLHHQRYPSKATARERSLNRGENLSHAMRIQYMVLLYNINLFVLDYFVRAVPCSLHYHIHLPLRHLLELSSRSLIHAFHRCSCSVPLSSPFSSCLLRQQTMMSLLLLLILLLLCGHLARKQFHWRPKP